MPLPKRPSGGAASQRAAPPDFGKSENRNNVGPPQDFALPDLDDFTLPDLDEPISEVVKVSSIPKTFASKPAEPDASSVRSTRPSSTNQDAPRSSQAAASDVLDVHEDDDEVTALNRELGLLDDDDCLPVKAAALEENGSAHQSLTDVSYAEEPAIDDTEEFEENLEEDDGEFNFEDLLKSVEGEADQSAGEDDEEEDISDSFEDLLNSFDDLDQSPNDQDSDDTEHEAVVELTEEENIDNDWETALADLESFNEATSSEASSEDEDEDEDEDEEWQMEEFTPPSNPFALPEDFESLETPEDDEEEEDEEGLPEDDFVPPSDPFANPFTSEPTEDDEDSSEDEENVEGDNEYPPASLKDKVIGLLSPEKAKQGFSDYLAKLKAELHGEDAPAPRSASRNRATENETEDANDAGSEELEEPGQSAGSRTRNPLKIFRFLSPIRAFYTSIVNIIFGIITAILGILSKLPLIGFIFKIALEATKVLRAIAQYIPLVFFIGILVAVSYFSVPRDSLIALPDSGGSTFTDFSYDASSNSASGTITNTGDIIADVQPEFTIKTIQPSLNPISWVIPQIASTCVAENVQVDIDATVNITAKCSDNVTGYIPRATGELK